MKENPKIVWSLAKQCVVTQTLVHFVIYRGKSVGSYLSQQQCHMHVGRRQRHVLISTSTARQLVHLQRDQTHAQNDWVIPDKQWECAQIEQLVHSTECILAPFAFLDVTQKFDPYRLHAQVKGCQIVSCRAPGLQLHALGAIGMDSIRHSSSFQTLECWINPQQCRLTQVVNLCSCFKLLFIMCLSITQDVPIPKDSGSLNNLRPFTKACHQGNSIEMCILRILGVFQFDLMFTTRSFHCWQTFESE